LLAQVEPARNELTSGASDGDAKDVLAQIPKLQGFELSLTRGEHLKEEDPLPAGDTVVEPVVYVQHDRHCLPVPGYVGVSRLTAGKIVEGVEESEAAG
jgi:hypothetical protein